MKSSEKFKSILSTLLTAGALIHDSRFVQINHLDHNIVKNLKLSYQM